MSRDRELFGPPPRTRIKSDDLRPQHGEFVPRPTVEECAEPTVTLVPASITVLPGSGAASGVREVLIAAAAAATYLRCCAVLLLLLTQFPSSWSRLACDTFHC